HVREELNRRAEPARLDARVARGRVEIEQLRAQLEQRARTQAEQKSGATDASRRAAEDQEIALARQKVVEREAEVARLYREAVAARDNGLAIVPRSLIDTGFSMTVGETVVVGTSRVQGDKAIIVLLTAVPRGVPR